MSEIQERLHEIQERMAEAAKRSGRRAQDVELIAVSKTIEVERINEAITCGVTRIGENKVQELMGKLPLLAPCERHFIGSLQANKVKFLIGEIALLHSLCSESTRDMLEKRGAAANWVCPVLIQVHIGDETSKAGIAPEQLEAFAESVLMQEHLALRGLMCIPPPAVGDEVRRYFGQLRECLEALKTAFPEKKEALRELSMGMSHDFEEAIEEGATLVRVGSHLFGERVYQTKK
jgi:pyridoxal phosphate enzyme, YggS family